MLSVIIPSYNEEGMISITAETITQILDREEIPFEIIFVNDGSKDNTWSEIEASCKKEKRIVGLNFSRNFGKEAAIFAGLEKSQGECCVVIDCDLQHPPEKIPEMYALWQNGYEIIEGVKSSRGKESVAHAMSAKIFYKAVSKATGVDLENGSDYKLLDRKVVNTLLNMHEKNAFFRALSAWVGYKATTVEFEVQERKVGETKWSTWSLVKYAMVNISSFSSAPMQIVTLLGIVTLIISFLLGSISLYQKFTCSAVDGFTTVIVALLFIGSVIMICLGIMGYYIARIYEEIKGRPRYIISSTCNRGEEK